MNRYFITFALLMLTVSIAAQSGYHLEKDISYVSSTEADAYRQERCKLDVYYPEDKTDFTTIVWFHGGGLTGGSKHIPAELTNKGVAVVAVNYRLSPKATNPAYTEDAAEAVAWVFRNIGKCGGSNQKIVLSGHSAGGYLALMLALDKSCLGKHNLDADRILACFPLSGQTMTHYTIRAERGLPEGIPIIDKYAPIQHARKSTPLIMLITGDRVLEMSARYEENAHLYAVLRGVGKKNVLLYELQGFDHGNMYAPGCIMMLEHLKKMENHVE